MSALAARGRRFAGWLRHLLRRVDEDRLPQAAASLAFTTLLGIVPLFALVFSILSAFPVFDDWVRSLEMVMERYALPETAHTVVSEYVLRFAAEASRLTGIGLLLIVVTAVAVVVTVEHQFNRIWRVRERRPWRRRVAIYWLLVTVGPFLVALSVTLTSWLVSLSHGLVRELPDFPRWVLEPLPMLATTAAVAILYLLLPGRPVRVRDALVGGAVAGVLFEVTKYGFALYVANVANFTVVYGALATLPIFLLWIYLSWLVVLAGAVITASLPDYGLDAGYRGRPVGGDFQLALRTLRQLVIAHDRGVSVDPRRIAREGAMGVVEAERILAGLREAGWAGRLDAGRWTLTIAPEAVRLSDVFANFVIAPVPSASVADPTERRVAQYVERAFDAASPENVSLRMLFTPVDVVADRRAAQPMPGRR